MKTQFRLKFPDTLQKTTLEELEEDLAAASAEEEVVAATTALEDESDA